MGDSLFFKERLDCLQYSVHQDLKEFCGSFDAGMKGLTLSNSDQIRTVHNSFARQTLFEFDSKKVGFDLVCMVALS